MGVRIAGCLEDRTVSMKGDGDVVVSKKCGLCGRSACYVCKKNWCFYGNSLCFGMLLSTLTLHYTEKSMNTQTARFATEI